MIQFNLLPDVKLEYIKVQRTKRLVVVVSALVSAAALVILLTLVLVVFVFQKRYMSALTADIKQTSSNLSNTSDINKILTVQNQLGSLTTLHDERQNTTKIFPYIKQITPSDISLASLDIDFDANTMSITGSSANNATGNKLAAINRFVDTLKFTKYSKDGTNVNAFSEVVLSNINRSDKDAGFTITLKYDPVIFSNTDDITLSVPNQITTRSETEKPGALFNGSTGSEN